MTAASEPQHVSRALSDLIALRGFARVRGDAQLSALWNEVAGTVIGEQTKVLGIRRGVLRVGVSNAPLLSELASFHLTTLLQSLQDRRPDLQIKNVKFRLNGHLEIGDKSTQH